MLFAAYKIGHNGVRSQDI